MDYAQQHGFCILCNSADHTFEACPRHPNNSCKSHCTLPLSSDSSSSSSHHYSSSHTKSQHSFHSSENIDNLSTSSEPILYQSMRTCELSSCLSLPNIHFLSSGPNISEISPPVPTSISIISDSVSSTLETSVYKNNNIINENSNNIISQSSLPSAIGDSISDSLSSVTNPSSVLSYATTISNLEILEQNLHKMSDPYCLGLAMYTRLIELKNKIIADSGATCHMNPHRSSFIHLIETPEAFVLNANGTQLPATHIGTTIQNMGGRLIILQNVLLVPDLQNPLFSIRQHRLTSGCSFHATNDGVKLSFPTFDILIDDESEMAIPFELASTNTANRNRDFIEPPNTNDTNDINFASVAMTRGRKKKLTQLLSPCIRLAPTNNTNNKSDKSVTFAPDTKFPCTSSTQKYNSSHLINPSTKFQIGDHVEVSIPPYSVYETIIIHHHASYNESTNKTHHEYKVRLPDLSLQYLDEAHISEISSKSMDELIEPPMAPVIDVTSDEAQKGKELLDKHLAELSSDSPSDKSLMSDAELDALNVLLKNVQRSYDKYGCITNKLQSNLEKYYAKKVRSTHIKPTSQTASDRPYFIPPHYKRNSAEPKDVRVTHQELYNFFGCRKLKCWDDVKEVANNNLKVVDLGEPITEIGEIANLKKSRRNKTPVPKPPDIFQTMTMDIGYADIPAIGGTTHSLLMVDRKSGMSYIQALPNLSPRSIISAISEIFTEIGTTPRRILTDFDHKLLGQEVKSWLAINKCTISGAPAGRQDQNGLTESVWKVLVHMARSYLTNKEMPREYWFHALRQASHVRNMMPVTSGGIKTTPYEIIYGIKPDYGLLTPIFATATILQHRDGDRQRGTFESQTMQAILLGRSSECDGYLLYSPFTKKFYNRSDIKIDRGRHTPNAFNLQYDGGLFIGLLDSPSTMHTVELYPPGTTLIYKNKDGVRIKGVVTSSPVPLHPSIDIPHRRDEKKYNVKLVTDEHVSIPMSMMPDYIDIDSNEDGIEHVQTLLPGWAYSNNKVQMLKNGKYLKGYLHFDDTTFKWSFQQRKRNGIIISSYDIPNFTSEFMSLVEAGDLSPGWKNTTQFNSNTLQQVHTANHVSAKTLKSFLAPTSIQKALDYNNPDHVIWFDSYKEEFEGLLNEGTFSLISHEEYAQLLLKHRIKRAIPTMCVFTIKKTNRVPTRAKSRIVVLGNLDPRDWSKSDCTAPVISQTAVRLLTALACKDNRRLKQGDCKFAFIQAELPEEELTVCRPPGGCPYSKGNKYWLLHKSLYGLKRAPRHWYTLCNKYLGECGLKSTTTDRCLYHGHPIEGKAPLYLGIYVDDFIYYSEDPEVEKAFEKKFAELTRVEFMGDVEWYLGINFRWSRDKENNLSCFLSQEGYADLILDRMDLKEANPVKSPYQSGFSIDSIPESNLNDEEQSNITHLYRQYLGMIGWLSISTRPDLATAYALLASYMSKPSKQHLEAAKYVGKYIKNTRNYGITFSHKRRSELETFAHLPIPQTDPISFTDSNWGPQDASFVASRDKKKKVSLIEPRSIIGFITVMCGGPIAWRSKKEKRTSLSSCEAEIKGINECTKSIEYLRNLLEEIGYPCNMPTPIYNDNKGSVQWANGHSNKNMRHVNIRENYVREAIHEFHTVTVQHIPGKNNISDILTKETKSVPLFEEQRDLLVSPWVPEEHGGCLDNEE